VKETVLMLFCGWSIHWLATIIKARETCKANKIAPPSLWEYWYSDPYSVLLSILGVVVCYFVIPTAAQSWPALADLIGQQADRPMTPMTALLGGYVSPSLADIMGKRFSALVS
jgi:hypothetical protein